MVSAIFNSFAQKIMPTRKEVSPVIESFRTSLETKIDNKISFYNEWDRLSNSLILDRQSIYNKYKNDFDEIKDLNEQQQDICRNQQIENDYTTPDQNFVQELQKEYDTIEGEIESKKEDLRKKVTGDFNGYLTRLGGERKHLAPQIASLFSPKALTSLAILVDEKCQTACKGIFRGKEAPKAQITLYIPESTSESVEVRATNETVCSEFLPTGQSQPQPLSLRCKFTSQAQYIIKKDGNIEVVGNFRLFPIIKG